MLRATIIRELEQFISEQLYFEVRNNLIQQGRVGRLAGPGGRTYLIRPPETEVEPVEIPQSSPWSEEQLMTRLEQYLGDGGPFQAALDLPSDTRCWVRDVSKIGPRSGQWARPDFVLVTASRFRLLPDVQVDVHAFELKAESGGSVQAVSEALAQTRFTHYGHLVWHVPEGSSAELQLSDVEGYCEHHGVGLILVRNPRDLESFEVRCDAERKKTPPATIEGFLEPRLSKEQWQDVQAFLRGRL